MSRPPASHTAIFILAPIWFAFSMAPAITRLASARVRVMRSILSGPDTRMLTLARVAGRPGHANTTPAKWGTAILLDLIRRTDRPSPLHACRWTPVLRHHCQGQEGQHSY